MAKELSIFIDESGDFGEYDPHSPYYIIGIVTHSQEDDITEALDYLDRGLKQVNFQQNCVHIGPLIRREESFRYMSVMERIRILRKITNFIAKIDIGCKTFTINKKHISGDVEMAAKLAKQISDFIKEHYAYFLSFDKIKIYYDNGQVEVTKIIISVFTTLFDDAEFKKAFQKDYRLAQVADLVCTAKLTELKMTTRTLSRSEHRVLGNDREIQKNLLKPIKKKEFKKQQ